jgi:hypothetical protein
MAMGRSDTLANEIKRSQESRDAGHEESSGYRIVKSALACRKTKSTTLASKRRVILQVQFCRKTLTNV